MNFNTHHVAFTVNNIEESVKWYSEKLGCIPVHTYDKNGMKIALIKFGDVQIELFNFGKSTKPIPEYCNDLVKDLHVVGIKHVCIEVENLETTIELFKENGVEFVTDIDTAGFGGRYIIFKDCNGILIELYQK